jgi:histidine ammonia-lyase
VLDALAVSAERLNDGASVWRNKGWTNDKDVERRPVGLDVCCHHRSGRKLGLSDAARSTCGQRDGGGLSARMDSSEPTAVYSINTGFGSLSGGSVHLIGAGLRSVTAGDLNAAGVGLRLELVARRGDPCGQQGLFGSACRWSRPFGDVDKGVTPWVPEYGSLGASGDLIPLAHVALVMSRDGAGEAEIDSGQAYFGGTLMSAWRR